MLEQHSGDFWCPLEEQQEPASVDMTARDWAALSRFSSGDWISDAHIDRLVELGLVERAFGQALLTRLGRAKAGVAQ